ncbi:hypothetical protein EYF80_034251 [Liparis tanakae]|uniref:Uncharacterized protein n=1 Tax=Liparis tanakae TaxID=230148 RepID=A0A4Z2GQ68_9TELE|nr:hypothetical protein EYF80_034251 [Liparis tanakae]
MCPSWLFSEQKITCVVRRAAAVVGVHAVHAQAAILAVVAWTVVDVVLTVLTGASALARRGAARHVGGLAVAAGVLLGTAAAVGADLVHAQAAVAAGRRALGALVHVLLAGLAVEGGRAGADVGGVEGRALAAVRAGVGRARVGELADVYTPDQPGGQRQRKAESVMRSHVPPLRQGELMQAWLVGVRHSRSPKPRRHTQRKSKVLP